MFKYDYFGCDRINDLEGKEGQERDNSYLDKVVILRMEWKREDN